MLRRWIGIGSVMAVAIVMLAADAGQARERRLFGRRMRTSEYNNYFDYGQEGFTPASIPGTTGMQRQSMYAPDAPSNSTQQMAAVLDVRTPVKAQITIEQEKTTQTGPRRTFISPPLVPGQNYTYEIKARWSEDGREVTRIRKVPVHAGERLTVDLTRELATDRQ